MSKVPALTDKAPEKVLAPDKVRIPVPVLVKPTVPTPSVKVPEKVVSVLRPPVVSTAVPAVPLVMRPPADPASARDPATWFLLFRLRVAPVAMLRAEALLSVLTLPVTKVPVLMVVVPA